MSQTPDVVDRVAATRRPNEPAIGYQNWRDLLFIHWRVPVDVVRPLVPERLTIDTYDGWALVGLIPFRMFGVRPRWLPPVPVLSSLREANVRTYVHLDGRHPGVWFFSLDASSLPAVLTARTLFLLPYFRASMRLTRHERHITYSSKRLWPGPYGAGYTIETEVGDPIVNLDDSRRVEHALPGTLEHFLVERYILYTADSRGRLYVGRVYHDPYPLREVRQMHVSETILRGDGLAVTGHPVHTIFSEGVDVEIFRLHRADR